MAQGSPPDESEDFDFKKEMEQEFNLLSPEEQAEMVLFLCQLLLRNLGAGMLKLESTDVTVILGGKEMKKYISLSYDALKNGLGIKQGPTIHVKEGRVTHTDPPRSERPN